MTNLDPFQVQRMNFEQVEEQARERLSRQGFSDSYLFMIHGDENEGFQDEGDFGPREFFSSPPGWQAAVIAISKIPDRERPGKVVGDYPGGEVSHDNLLRVLSRAINSNQAISREFKSEEDIIQDLRYHGVLQG